MKKAFTFWLLTMIAFGYTATAQSTRLVLCEEFTQASCPPCASQNPTFNALLNQNASKVVAIKYQTSWPGTDPMNDQTQSMVDPRVGYYACNGVPYSLMDGDTVPRGTSVLYYEGAPHYWSAPTLNAEAALSSKYTLGVTHTFNATLDSMYINIDIANTGADTGTLVLHVAVIEREIPFCNAPGTNGETVFEGVMRTMLPDAYGTSLAGIWAPGQTQNKTFAIKVPAYVYDKNELAVVAFIQDDNTKNVRQAGYSAPQQIANDSKLNCSAISGIPIVSCGTPISPVVKFDNIGSSTLTSLTINYAVDGVPVTPIAWTGNVITTTSGTANLTGLNTNVGAHVLTVAVASPNGSSDYNNYYDTISVNYNISSSSGATNLPLVEPFSTPVFPPANWIMYNPDNGFGWEQSAEGFNGLGCALANFWGSPTGEIDEIWTPNYDFSGAGVSSVTVDFDVAYARYNSGSTDRLKVLYSVNCGQTWLSAYDESGAALATGNASTTTLFVPTVSQWHHKVANLPTAVGNSNVFIKFQAISNYGNNCYVDNINVNTNLTTGVSPISNNQDINVYPNPSNGDLKVKLNLAGSQDVSIVVVNSLGAIVKTLNLQNVTNGVYDVDMKDAAKGAYEVSIRTNDNVVTKRISITE